MEIRLRPWKREDAPALQQCADEYEIARNLRDVFPHPYTLADAETYINLCLAGDCTRQLCCAIEVDGRLAGSIGLFCGTDVYRKSAELGYWLGKAFWGRGVMTEAVRQICREGFSRFDIARIYAEPFARNTGSRRVLEKNGFSLEGTLRQGVYKEDMLQDYCIYALLREDDL